MSERKSRSNCVVVLCGSDDESKCVRVTKCDCDDVQAIVKKLDACCESSDDCCVPDDR